MILDRHTEVFKDELGLLKTMSAKIQVDPQAQPKFCKPRPVPHALRDKVNEEIEHLEKQASLSQWSTQSGRLLLSP